MLVNKLTINKNRTIKNDISTISKRENDKLFVKSPIKFTIYCEIFKENQSIKRVVLLNINNIPMHNNKIILVLILMLELVFYI